MDGAQAGARPSALVKLSSSSRNQLTASSRPRWGATSAFARETYGWSARPWARWSSNSLRLRSTSETCSSTPRHRRCPRTEARRPALAGALALDPLVGLPRRSDGDARPGCGARKMRDAVGALTKSMVLALPDRRPSLADAGRRRARARTVGRPGRPAGRALRRRPVVADGPVRTTLDARARRLLAMGMWVPGAARPSRRRWTRPSSVPWAARHSSHGLDTAATGRSSADVSGNRSLAAGPRRRGTTRLVDGTARRAGPPSWPCPSRPRPDPHSTRRPERVGKVDRAARPRGFLATTDPRRRVCPSSGHPGACTSARPSPDAVPPGRSPPPTGLHPRLGAAVVELDDRGAHGARRGVGHLPRPRARTRRRQNPTVVAPPSTDRALLAALGLGHLEEADPRHLSGGDQRRLAVAAALHHGPPVLLADEPTVGQDRGPWAALVGLVAAYRVAGGAVVTATHDAHVVDRATTVHHLSAPLEPPMPEGAGVPLVARCGALALLRRPARAARRRAPPHWTTSLAVLAIQWCSLWSASGRPAGGGGGGPGPPRRRGDAPRLGRRPRSAGRPGSSPAATSIRP